ncbi:MAG: DNA polymerase III subunit gamma/tau [Gammaproteobacteria bacterium]|nr:DNA polymerase III subunit gamma/tau [Gammaproteobacteria bacterium]
MSYQVLARKWRPRNFAELVGQEHVVRALTHALDNDRLHHAFLFTGTRGVGKTTLARVLAKALNCEQGVSSTPCGACSACREIDEGRFIDLIEVDAASRTKVEDTRELLENVQYAPTRGRYKVYLVDEVHMLSTHSFNALLKTLEEPPPHVKFLLATTDPQKLPVTILSRCLQFNLKRVPLDLITRQIEHILQQEGVNSEAAACKAIARAADGSLRDALSLVDQAIAYGGGALRETDVQAMLGNIEQTHVLALLEALSQSNAQALLERVELMGQHAADFEAVLADLLTQLHRIALAQIMPDAIGDDEGGRDAVLALARAITAEDVQLFYQIGTLGRRDLPLAPESQAGFEMLLLRMLAFRPVTATQTAPSPAPAKAASAAPVAPAAKGGTGVAAPSLPPAASSEWAGMIDALKLTGMTRQLAANCVLVAREGPVVHLLLDAAQAHLQRKTVEQQLQQALQKHLGVPVKLDIATGKPEQETPALTDARLQNDRQQAALQVIEGDVLVQTLCATFNTRVQPDAVRVMNKE